MINYILNEKATIIHLMAELIKDIVLILYSL